MAETQNPLQEAVVSLARGKGPVTREEIRRVLERVIQASQGNFDHISGESTRNVTIFNKFMSDLESDLNEVNVKLANLEDRIAALES